MWEPSGGCAKFQAAYICMATNVYLPLCLAVALQGWYAIEVGCKGRSSGLSVEMYGSFVAAVVLCRYAWFYVFRREMQCTFWFTPAAARYVIVCSCGVTFFTGDSIFEVGSCCFGSLGFISLLSFSICQSFSSSGCFSNCLFLKVYYVQDVYAAVVMRCLTGLTEMFSAGIPTHNVCLSLRCFPPSSASWGHPYCACSV